MDNAAKFSIEILNRVQPTFRIRPRLARSLSATAIFASLAWVAPCQEFSAVQPAHADIQANDEGNDASKQESRHILGIIPNYRTYPSLLNYKPLPTGEKFKIASEDSLDRGTFALAGLFGGLGQLTNSNKSFGQGGAGFGRYFGTSYGDLLIGNYMSEAVYPSILHQDPRYFRRGTGNGRSRFAYAVSQVFWTHRDSGGGRQFNYSEWLGNSTAVAISNAYYRDGRDVSSALSKLVMQVGVDAVGNVLKEFWPDLRRKFSKRSRDNAKTMEKSAQ
jgi:hypothetical protein